ncbi:hypothetical protein B9G53_19165 [Pseudanabaena sp. SR411]|nr:hypothetical protein B9G53_19165 [Pseudanabaena sp. SR411]
MIVSMIERLRARNLSVKRIKRFFILRYGQTSLPEALKVGALIEETDIKDWRDRLNTTANPQIKATYGYLLQGSYNHLQAFVRQIERQGGSYIPQVLSQQELTEILAQGHRSGRR